MEKVEQAIFQCLSGDSEALVGLRALLKNTGTAPYNIYYAFWPSTLDFISASSTQNFITYQFVSGASSQDNHNVDANTEELLYDITVYSRSRLSVKAIHRRIKWILQGMRKVAQPSTQTLIMNLLKEAAQPDRWDDAFKVWFQTVSYRVWAQDNDYN